MTAEQLDQRLFAGTTVLTTTTKYRKTTVTQASHEADY
jgi:hypothetical protein